MMQVKQVDIISKHRVVEKLGGSTGEVSGTPQTEKHAVNFLTSGIREAYVKSRLWVS